MGDIDLRHLRSFVAIAEAGSINEASRLLYVAQPALSRQMAALERKTGMRLLDRTRTGTVLTRDGQRFLLGATKVLAAYDDMDITEAASDDSSGPRGLSEDSDELDGEIGAPTTMRLGVEADAPDSTSDAIRDFARTRPGARWRVARGHEADLRASLQVGHLDAAVLWVPPDSTRFAFTVVSTVSFLAALPAALAPPPGSPVPGSLLTRHPFALWDRTDDPVAYDYWTGLLAEGAGGPINFVGVPQHDNAQDEMLRAVAQDSAISIVTMAHWAKSPRDGVEVRHMDPPLDAPLHLVWRAGHDSAWIADLASAF